MLKKIICKEFQQPEVTFHNGLNVVCGDNVGSNSIGKTTFLMIIDFVFGGSSYIKVNRDVVKHVGHHSIKFIFEFNGKNYYFSRSTSESNKVYSCTETFELQKEYKVSEFCSWLQQNYNCELFQLSFRNIIGRYFRIYGKENLNEKKPLQYVSGEKIETEIMNLVKLFDKYKPLSNLSSYIKDVSEKEKLLKQVNSHDILNFPTKKGSYTQNKKEINSLSKELNNLTDEIQTGTTDLESLISSELLAFQSEKEAINIEITRRKVRLKRLEKNLSARTKKVSTELGEITNFFNEINTERLQEIDKFHADLSEILKKNIKKEQKATEKELVNYQEQLAQLQLSINNILDEKRATKLPVNRILELRSAIDKLENQNKMYEERLELSREKAKEIEAYDNLWFNQVDEISNIINSHMQTLNKIVYPNGRQSPILNLHKKNYTFQTSNDTGTGTAFVNLLIFDLSILTLTLLPALAHDLPLIKNIENNAFEHILKLYNTFEKQIFIVVDKSSSYPTDAQKIISENTILNLNDKKTLFKLSWKHEE